MLSNWAAEKAYSATALVSKDALSHACNAIADV